MARRVTVKEIEYAIDSANHHFMPCGFKLELGQRYGYKAIDLYEAGKPYGSGMLETLESGLSAKQALQYVRALSMGARMVSDEHRQGKCKVIKRRKRRK